MLATYALRRKASLSIHNNVAVQCCAKPSNDLRSVYLLISSTSLPFDLPLLLLSQRVNAQIISCISTCTNHCADDPSGLELRNKLYLYFTITVRGAYPSGTTLPQCTPMPNMKRLSLGSLRGNPQTIQAPRTHPIPTMDVVMMASLLRCLSSPTGSSPH